MDGRTPQALVQDIHIVLHIAGLKDNDGTFKEDMVMKRAAFNLVSECDAVSRNDADMHVVENSLKMTRDKGKGHAISSSPL